jgi:hypothetical protein
MADKGEQIDKIGHWGECDRCNTEHFNEGQIKELGFEYLCAKCIEQIKMDIRKEILCPNHDNRPKIFCSKCADTIKETAFKEGDSNERRKRFQYIDKWQKEFRESHKTDFEYARQKTLDEVKDMMIREFVNSERMVKALWQEINEELEALKKREVEQ